MEQLKEIARKKFSEMKEEINNEIENFKMSEKSKEYYPKKIASLMQNSLENYRNFTLKFQDLKLKNLLEDINKFSSSLVDKEHDALILFHKHLDLKNQFSFVLNDKKNLNRNDDEIDQNSEKKNCFSDLFCFLSDRALLVDDLSFLFSFFESYLSGTLESHENKRKE